MTKTKLTGVTRYRVQNRFLRSPVLVLQVEYTVKGFEHVYYCSTNSVDYIGWRDATVEDLPSQRIKHD